MIAWIAQGLEKVVPQPDLKVKESPAAAEQVHQRHLQEVLQLWCDQRTSAPPSGQLLVHRRVLQNPETKTNFILFLTTTTKNLFNKTHCTTFPMMQLILWTRAQI